MTTATSKPALTLTGTDGNAFAVMGAAFKAARGAGWTADEVAELRAEMVNGNYNHLMATVMDRFEVS